MATYPDGQEPTNECSPLSNSSSSQLLPGSPGATVTPVSSSACVNNTPATSPGTSSSTCRLQKQVLQTKQPGNKDRRFSYSYESVLFDNGQRAAKRESDASQMFSPGHTRRNLSSESGILNI